MTVVEHKTFDAEERRALADKDQAMPGGEYPIRNVSDLKNAIQAYGRAKDKDAVKRWIIKRARQLNATDFLPDGWLDELEQSAMKYLQHYGVKGMRWGVRKKTRYSDTAPKNLSDAEIRQRISRMELEARYTRLNSGRIDAGREYATGILSNSGRQAVGAAVGTGASFVVGRALRNRFGSN